MASATSRVNVARVPGPEQTMMERRRDGLTVTGRGHSARREGMAQRWVVSVNTGASAFEWALAGWMLWSAYQRIALTLQYAGIDAAIYITATKRWLAGGNPWEGAAGLTFAAPPPTLLPMIPFALLPAELGVPLLMAVCAGAAVFVIRRLHLPWYWLAFMPLVDSVIGGNPDILVVACIVGGAGWLGAMFKIYALVPILLERRALLIALVVLIATAPFVPWLPFLTHYRDIMGTYTSQGTSLGAWAVPVLIIPTVIALLALPRKEMLWLAVPALWPVVQLHYAVFMLPVANPIFALAMTTPTPGVTAVAVIVYALWYRRGALLPIARKFHVVQVANPIGDADTADADLGMGGALEGEDARLGEAHRVGVADLVEGVHAR